MATFTWSSTPRKGRRRWPTAAPCGALPSCIKCHITPLFRVPWRPRRVSAPIWAETLRSAPCRVIFPKPDLCAGPCVRQLIGNEVRIAELEDKLARADIIDISKLSGDTIKFGATVTLVDEDTDKKAVWQIVGEPEADAKKGRISITSPLARALIGKKKGASVEVVAPGGAKAYEITKVEWR